MPTYDYRCDACGHTFSRMQRFGDEPVSECPKCGARPRRLVSVPAIVFKGSGWHINDYRPKSADASSDGTATKDTNVQPKDAPKTDAEKKTDATKKDAAKENAPAKSDGSAS